MRNRSITAVTMVMAAVMAIEAAGCGTVVEPADITVETTSREVLDLSAIRAQDDFYGYINASYLAGIEDIDDGYAGSFFDLSSDIDMKLEAIISEIADGDRASYMPGSNEQLIYDFYYQVLDASTGGEMMSEEDIDDFEDRCHEILDAGSIDELIDIAGELNMSYGTCSFFEPVVLPDLRDSGKGAVIINPFTCSAYEDLEFIMFGGYEAQSCANAFSNVLIDLGIEREEAEARAISDTGLLIEIGYATDFTLLHQIEEDSDDISRYLIYKTCDEIDQICPNMGHEGMLRAISLEPDAVDGMYVILEEQLASIDSLMTEDNLEAWKDIVLVNFVYGLKDILPSEYGGTPVLYSNDQLAVNIVMRYLGDVLGEEYIERYYDESTAETIEKMAHDIRDEYVDLIYDCEWMSEEGKELVIQKLMNMTFFIGADEPHEIEPSDEDIIGSSLYQSRMNLNIKEHQKTVRTLDGSYMSNGFDMMPPQTVNACYLAQGNSIVIPFGIMHAPFYDPEASYYTNLGGIGAIIGHEISHAFDDSGMKFDSNGNYAPEWMPVADREAFAEVSQSISDYYSSFTILTYHNVDGELTLGENMADISGVDVVLRFADTLEQKQEIFENYARTFATVSPREQATSSLVSDPHSPEHIRINATVALFDEFYEIYDVTDGDQMYVHESDRVRRW